MRYFQRNFDTDRPDMHSWKLMEVARKFVLRRDASILKNYLPPKRASRFRYPLCH